MKIRQGFVSNSSSSSFVIAKNYMTEEQIKQFAKWLQGKQNSDEWDGGWISNSTYYFIGTIEQSLEEEIGLFLESIGIDTKYAEFNQ